MFYSIFLTNLVMLISTGLSAGESGPRLRLRLRLRRLRRGRLRAGAAHLLQQHLYGAGHHGRHQLPLHGHDDHHVVQRRHRQLRLLGGGPSRQSGAGLQRRRRGPDSLPTQRRRRHLSIADRQVKATKSGRYEGAVDDLLLFLLLLLLFSVEPTAVSSLADGADRRGRHLPQLTSSRDEDVDVDVVDVKRPQKRQLIPRPFQTTIITASVVTSFVVTTTTVPLAGSDYTCTPPGFATCA